MASFVTTEQYETATQTTLVADSPLEDAVEFHLDAACAAIRKATCQTLDLVDDDEVVLHGTGHESLLLPQVPVVDVTSVIVDAGLSTETEVTDYVVGFDGSLYRRVGWPWGYGNITVTYSHGYAEIPADLVNVAIQAARTGVTIAPGGITSETIGGYSYTRDASATTAAVSAYSTVLDLYRVPRVPVP